MRRSTLVFGLFVVIIAGIVGTNTFLKNQPPLELTIAVDPMIEDWAKSLAEGFNAKNVMVSNGTTKIHIKIDATKNDVTVWTGKANWTSDTHPTAWIASSSASLTYLPTNMTFTTLVPSLARTPLVWGGFSTRVALITQNETRPFNWETVHEISAAQRWSTLGAPTSWGNVNMGIDWATSSVSGYASLMSMAASYQQSALIDRNALTASDFQTWFAPIKDAIQNSERLGESPASAMASRGASVADFALLTEMEWLRNLNNLNKTDLMTFAYPDYNFVLDFPIAIWNDSKTTTAEQEAVKAFANYVLSADGQQLALSYGLRPVTGEPQTTDTLFANGVSFGIALEPNYGTLIQIPDRNTSEQLLRLLN